jgi:hypothetical protein
MTKEKDIWTVAALPIGQHGGKAESVAERRAADAARRGDAVTHGIWVDVGECCRELLKDAPAAGEQVH